MGGTGSHSNLELDSSESGRNSDRVPVHPQRMRFGVGLIFSGEHVALRGGRWAAGTNTYKVDTRHNPEDSEAVSPRLLPGQLKGSYCRRNEWHG